MLTAVSVTNPRGGTLQLPLVNGSGFTVRDIEGLDPVTATLSTSSLAQQDGADPQHARRDTRNITMKIGLEPDYASQSVSGLRSTLYDYFMTKANVVLGFYMDGELFVTSAGQVEDFQAPMFVEDPEADISIICYNPDFVGMAVELDGTTRTDQVPTTIDYPGTSDAGLIFSLTLTADLSELVLYNTTPSNVVQKMTIDGVFLAGDNIVVNTIPGQRAVTLIRSGLPSSLLTGLGGGSTWLTFQRGQNFFRAIAAGSQAYVMTYTPLYGGL